MKKLIKKHQLGGWISWLGQEGVPTLRSLQYYGSYNNPVQLPELVVTGQERVPLSFDRRQYGFPGGRSIITDALYDYYHTDDGTYTGDDYMGDNAPVRGGRVIYVNPDKQNDTIWVEPTPRVNDPAVWEKYGSKPNSYVEFQYLPAAENQNKAKQTFYKNVKKSKPSVGDKKETQAWKRAKKGN